MHNRTKSSVTSWWILAMMSLFLWYRNEKYDRALSVFVFLLGLVQLIEYGIYSGADPNQTGRALFITLWLQCLVLAIGVFIFVNGAKDPDHTSTNENIVSTICEWNLFLFSLIFTVALISSFSLEFDATITPDGIEWKTNGNSFLGNWSWLYVIGIFIPLLLIFAFSMWADLQIAILIIYVSLTASYITRTYPSSLFASSWSYFSVGFAFLAWFSGAFSDTSTKNI